MQSGAVDPSIYAKCASAGLLVPIAFGKTIPPQYSHYPVAAGIKPSDWDGFHDLILWDELIRAGPIASLFIGLVVGAPPLQKFASPELAAKIFPEILSGEKRIFEAFYRAVPSFTVPGGSEDVLIDLGVREALKLHEQASKLQARM